MNTEEIMDAARPGMLFIWQIQILEMIDDRRPGMYLLLREPQLVNVTGVTEWWVEIYEFARGRVLRSIISFEDTITVLHQ